MVSSYGICLANDLVFGRGGEALFYWLAELKHIDIYLHGIKTEAYAWVQETDLGKKLEWKFCLLGSSSSSSFCIYIYHHTYRTFLSLKDGLLSDWIAREGWKESSLADIYIQMYKQPSKFQDL